MNLKEDQSDASEEKISIYFELLKAGREYEKNPSDENKETFERALEVARIMEKSQGNSFGNES